jgi:predicted transcriptional regulator
MPDNGSPGAHVAGGARVSLSVNDADKPMRYWWRLPDDLEMLMSLTPAELRCFMIVMHAIQRDRNEGEISLPQIAERAQVSRKTAQQALASLITRGRLNCEKRQGATAVYRLPFSWVQKENRSPTGDQLAPTGDHHASPKCAQRRSPTGDEDRSPAGDPHLQSPEDSESASEDVGHGSPQHHSVSSSENDAVGSDVEQIKSALRNRACVKCAFTESDIMAIRRMLDTATVETVLRAILLGCQRKLAALMNRGNGSLITSVYYFANLIEEVKGISNGPGYWRHVEDWVTRHEREWTSRKGPARCGDDAGVSRSGGVS